MKMILQGCLVVASLLFSGCQLGTEEVSINSSADAAASKAKAGAAPTANAGSDQTVALSAGQILLDGGKSSASGNTSISGYAWSQVSGPSTGTFSSPFTVTTAYSPLSAGTYTFRLKVTASNGKISTDDVVITVVSDTVIPPAPASNVLFYGPFNNVTVAPNSSNTGMTMTGWEDLLKVYGINNYSLNNIGGVDYAFQQIVTDPAGSGRKVMWAQVLDDDPSVSGTTRAQLSVRFNSVDLGIYHTSHRMYIHPDVDHLRNYPDKVDWFTIYEIWNEDGISKGIFPDGDPAGSSRISFHTYKDAGIGAPFYWDITAEYMQPSTVRFDNIFTQTNRTVPVPIGKWFKLDLWLKRGDSSNGRLVITITPDGGQPIVLFDVRGATQYPGHPELNLYSMQPFKFYLGDKYLDWMRNAGKKLAVCYDEFTLYKD